MPEYRCQAGRHRNVPLTSFSVKLTGRSGAEQGVLQTQLSSTQSTTCVLLSHSQKAIQTHSKVYLYWHFSNCCLNGNCSLKIIQPGAAILPCKVDKAETPDWKFSVPLIPSWWPLRHPTSIVWNHRNNVISLFQQLNL